MKRTLIMTAPFNTKSGYGEHARDIFYSLYDLERFDIKLIDTPWGDTPRDYLDPENKRHKLILDRLVYDLGTITQQPEIYVDCRIPNEFETHGKFNIGITAGVETTAVSSNWLENCNKMDLVLVPSQHSKDGFVNSTFDKMQNLPNGQKQKIGELKLEKPMEVLFEGANLDIFKPLKHDELVTDVSKSLNDIKEDFCFLFVGMWTQGGKGEDRKNIYNLLKYFYETFANKKNPPALVLKTSGAHHSVIDRETIKQKIGEVKSMFPSYIQLPQVYLLHGHLNDDEMNELYNHPKIKAMVSLTHGEGFGRPLLEATMTGLPVIASAWSGHKDFLNSQNCLMIGGDLVDVPKSMHWENIIIPQSKWFEVGKDEVYNAFRFAVKNKYDIKQNAKKLMKINRNKFSHDRMTDKLGEMLDKHLTDLPQQVSVKLPELKKTKIKLPSLTKVKTEDKKLQTEGA
tara:strand:+ start:301 stop:1668 length:1368 start_codon:yes stop_codon:yes gene_type:complete